MCTRPERWSWSAERAGTRNQSLEYSCSSLSTILTEASRESSVLPNSSPEMNESNFMHNGTLDKESSFDSPDRILGHCFKQFKLREEHPHFFFKVKKSRFGPPRSRRRIFIAPPMKGSPKHQPRVPFGQKEKTTALEMLPEAGDTLSAEEDEAQQLEAWIEERKKLHNLLNNCVNLEEWLTAKQPETELEASVLGKIRECKEPKEVKMEDTLEAVKSIEHLMPKRVQRRVLPLIDIPYPESLKTLQNLLHKQKVKLVDLFNKADRSKTMKFKRTDFIRIIKETKVPISKNDLEDAVIYLTSLKKGNYITNEDLAECQRIWTESLRDQSKQTKRTSIIGQRTKLASTAQSKPKSQQMKYLEVPPINTEPDRMHLTYNQMEFVGKRYKEMRRLLKRKINPLDFAEQCQMVKTGDLAVDGHCKPSTMEGEVGELVDKHRLACHLVWTQCVKLCKKYGVPITEKALKKGLLYPGDRILREGNHFRKIRQPGGYYSGSPHSQASSSSSSSSQQSRISSAAQKGKPKPKAEKEEVITEHTQKYRWMSFAEFRKLTSKHSKRLLPPVNFWKKRTIYESILETPEMLEEQYVEREMRKMFAFLNPLTDPNSFWPGHLLDKLRLYLPQMEHDGGHALFSRVSHTTPVYPAVYTPDRHWPVSDQGYVTYGDPDSQKHYYYI